MEYIVSSFKEAIDVTIDSKDIYDKNDISLIKRLIEKALKPDLVYFTSTAGARNYIKNNPILRELKETTNTISNDINEIIEAYIDKFFNKKINLYEEIKDRIKEKTNLQKVKNKLDSLYKEEDYLNKRWVLFSNIFNRNDSITEESRKKTIITSEELKYDMIYVALEEAEFYRDKATVLKAIDPYSDKLTKMDVIKVVEEYVYTDKIDELLQIINSNMCLAGHLLQNLFDSFNKVKINKFSLNELDKEIEKIDDVKLRGKVLIQILNGEKIEGINLEKERVIVDLLKNTLALNVYTNKEKSMDYTIRRLYTGESIENDEQIIHNRIITNNEIANNLVINGKNTTNDYLINLINNLNDKEKYFLANIYVLSRSLKNSKNILDSSIFHGTNEQIYVYGLLEVDTLIEELKQQNQNVL